MTTTKPAKTNDRNETEDVGPNGYRLGFTENGDKVEWVPDDEHPGQELPLLLRRNDNDIGKACKEFWEQVWWNRHKVELRRIETPRNHCLNRKRLR